MNGSRHNKNENRQTEIPERRIYSAPIPPKLRIFSVDYYRSFEAHKMVFGPALDQILICLIKMQKHVVTRLGQ